MILMSYLLFKKLFTLIVLKQVTYFIKFTKYNLKKYRLFFIFQPLWLFCFIKLVNILNSNNENKNLTNTFVFFFFKDQVSIFWPAFH